MNILFLVTLIVQAASGFGLVLLPGPLASPLGLSLDPAATVFARLFGSALLALAVLLLSVYRVQEVWFRRAMLSAETIYFALALVVFSLAQLAGLINAWGWLLALVHAVLLVWYLVYVRRPL